MSFEPRDATSKRVFELAVRLVGERYRDVIETVYSIGVVDGQLKAIERTPTTCALWTSTKEGPRHDHQAPRNATAVDVR